MGRVGLVGDGNGDVWEGVGERVGELKTQCSGVVFEI